MKPKLVKPNQMKKTLNLLVALYLASWMVSVSVFENFQLINMSYLLITIVAVLMIFAVKGKKIFKKVTT